MIVHKIYITHLLETLVSLSKAYHYSSLFERFTYHPDPSQQTVFNSGVNTDTDPSIVTHYTSYLGPVSNLNDLLIIAQVSCRSNMIMNHHHHPHHHCYILFNMIHLEHCPHPLC